MLTFPIDDSPLGQIIWRELHDNPVSAQNSNVILAHLPRNMGCDDVIVVQFHPKRCVRQCLQDSAIHFNLIFFRQNIRLFPRPSSVIPGAIQPEPTCIKAYFKVHLCPKIGRTKLAMFVQLILRNRFISNFAGDSGLLVAWISSIIASNISICPCSVECSPLLSDWTYYNSVD